MATLKISDLSAGDWVQVLLRKCDYDEPDTFKAKVLTVVNNSVGVGYDNSGIVMSALVEDLQPIPITAEILEKNGFVKKNYDNGKMWDWWCDNVLVRKFADEDIYRFIVVFDSKHYTTTMVVGKHTHQLQHALRLAGVAKEINL